MSSDVETALKSQVGGNHYKDLAIQPAEYNQRNKLGFCEGCVVKYVSRHGSKNKRQDIDKAIHFLRILNDLEYPNDEPMPERSHVVFLVEELRKANTELDRLKAENAKKVEEGYKEGFDDAYRPGVWHYEKTPEEYWLQSEARKGLE